MDSKFRQELMNPSQRLSNPIARDAPRDGKQLGGNGMKKVPFRLGISSRHHRATIANAEV